MRTVVPRTTWRPLTLFGQPGSSSFFVPLEVFCHADWYHGRILIHPLSLRVPLRKRGCSHTRRFGILTCPPPPVGGMPWVPHRDHHFVSDPVLRNKDTSVEFATLSFSLSLILHVMSLNIDMMMIRLVLLLILVELVLPLQRCKL